MSFPLLMLGCPIRSSHEADPSVEAEVLTLYPNHLLQLHYPKELTSLVFLPNDCTHATLDLLAYYQAGIGSLYRRFEVVATP